MVITYTFNPTTRAWTARTAERVLPVSAPSIGRARRQVSAEWGLPTSEHYDVESPVLAAAVGRYREARRIFDEAGRALRVAQSAAIDALVNAGMSTRDTAPLLGVSHQRVFQVQERRRSDA